MRGAAILLGLAALSAPVAAEPLNWIIDAGASRIGIVYLVNGEERRGEIGRFSGAARFDPEDVSAARLTLEIDMASVDVGEPFGTMIVKTGDWFHVSEHPTARYELDRMEPLGDGRYRAFGRLTMRGAEHPVSGELSVNLAGHVAGAQGEAAFPRSLYGIGVGFTALFVEVGDEVGVVFDLTAVPEGE